MDVCDASKHNPQKLPSILAKNHDFEQIVKLRLIYGTNVSKNRKNTTNVVCVFFSPREKKTEKCASGEVGRRSYVSAQKKKTIPLCIAMSFDQQIAVQCRAFT